MNHKNKWMPALWGIVFIATAILGVFAWGDPGGLSFHEFGGSLGLCIGSVAAAAPIDANELKNILGTMRSNVETMENQTKGYETQLKELKDSNAELQRQLASLRKAALNIGAARGSNPERGKFVSDDCARHLAAIVILSAERYNKLTNLSNSDREELVKGCKQILGLEAKAALTTSDIPLPTSYGSEVVELVWMYGQARKHGTVYPLGTGTVKLPKLKTTPAFGFIDVSAAIPEKSPQIQFADFTAEKAGGMIRIPSEISEDSIVPLGQFIARYIAREMAKWEDVVFYTADGSATYKTMKGIGKAAVDLGNLVQLAATKTKPSDITLADLRLLRTKVDTEALNSSAYYVNMTHEQLFSSFNTGGDLVYIANGVNGPTLDGYPVRWVDVLPVYDTAAHASQIQVLFGDASYQYLGIRDAVRVETSNEVYFATDEIAVRALERFDVELMADKAVAALQLAAS